MTWAFEGIPFPVKWGFLTAFSFYGLAFLFRPEVLEASVDNWPTSIYLISHAPLLLVAAMVVSVPVAVWLTMFYEQITRGLVVEEQ